MLQCWQGLEKGAKQPGQAFRLPVVGTGSAQNADLRTVVLRHADQSSRLLSFYTDSRSPKALQLLKFGQASWLFFDPQQSLQLRVHSQASFHHRNHVTRKLWETLSADSRAVYANPAAPGIKLPEHETELLSDQEAYLNFLVVECTVNSIDCLRLSHTGNQRAKFSWEGQCWRGERLSP